MVISEFVGVVVSTSDEKKAPPYLERLHKEHCIYYLLINLHHGATFILDDLVQHNMAKAQSTFCSFRK